MGPILVLVATFALLAHWDCAGARKPPGTREGSARLMKELVEIYKSESYKSGVFSVELVDDNLYEWDVKLNIMDREKALRKDLDRLKRENRGEDHIKLRISYGPDYPAGPPFVRVIYPVLNSHFSFSGGSICLELLSKQGWLPDCTSESLILAVLQNIMDGFTRVAFGTLTKDRGEVYTEEEARKGFAKVEKFHGWHRARGSGQEGDGHDETQ